MLGKVFVVLFFVLVFGGSLFYYFHSKAECDANHGVLVHGAIGYSCAAAPHKAK